MKKGRPNKIRTEASGSSNSHPIVGFFARYGIVPDFSDVRLAVFDETFPPVGVMFLSLLDCLHNGFSNAVARIFSFCWERHCLHLSTAYPVTHGNWWTA